MSERVIAFLRVGLIVAIVGGLCGWVVVRSIRNAERPWRMLGKWLLSLFLCVLSAGAVWYFLRTGFPLAGLILVAICASLLSYMWTPDLGAFLAKPITSLFDGGDASPEPRPAYSIAQAKQKRGRYIEAIAEIRRQLERFPADVEGQMLMAQIQAEDLKDMVGAELTIQRFCAQPGHAPANIAFALYSLADWQLQFGPDRQAAQRALEQVMQMLPDTEFALTAAHRIAHLADAELLLAPHESRTYPLVEGPRRLGLTMHQEPLKPVEKDPAQQAAEYVRHLEEHPLDTEAREQLAMIYARHYQRLDLATDQLEQMIQQPNQPGRLVVRWLNLLADLQVKAGVGYDAVRETLQRIIDRDPHLAAAETARKRIDLLKLEMKSQEKSQAVRLGVYEQNLGLKQARARMQRPPGTA